MPAHAANSAGPVALVTGSSSGFGRGVADELHARGWTVVGGMRDPSQSAGVEWHSTALDVTDEDAVADAFDMIEARWGRLDALVNNAGFLTFGPVEELTAAEWRDQLDVNLIGAMTATRRALPMLRKTSGVVVQVSSINGQVSEPMVAAYAASKFALEAASEALADEVRAAGVRVVLVEPGQFRTRLASNATFAARRDESGPYQDDWDGLFGSIPDFNAHAPDPHQCIGVIVAAVTRPDAPMRLPVGDGVSDAIREHAHSVLAQLDEAESFLRDL